MRKTGLIAAAALVAAALPLTIATTAMAQLERGGGGGRAAGAAPAAPAAPAGGGGGAFRGGMGGGVASGGGGIARGGPLEAGPRGGGVAVAPQAGWSGPRPGWSGSRPGWNSGSYYHRHHHGRRFIGPGFGFGTGLLLGGAYAASPYYYDDYDPYYYDTPPVVGSVGPSADDEAYCRRRYRSYDPASGTYLNNDGNRYPCP